MHYASLHRKLRLEWGDCKICESCGTEEAKKYEWSNKDHLYSTNREDWQYLCVSCHRKYDNETFGREIWNKGKQVTISPEHRAKIVAALRAKGPWNKGKKTGLVPSSAFKEGNTPWNKKI